VNEVDDLQRGVHEVLADGQVDLARVLRRMAGHQRGVALAGLSPLELHAERAVGRGIARQDDHAARVAVEPVHDARARPPCLQPRHQAIGLLGPDSRHREQPAGLVDDQQPAVLVDDGEAVVRHGRAARG